MTIEKHVLSDKISDSQVPPVGNERNSACTGDLPNSKAVQNHRVSPVVGMTPDRTGEDSLPAVSTPCQNCKEKAVMHLNSLVVGPVNMIHQQFSVNRPICARN